MLMGIINLLGGGVLSSVVSIFSTWKNTALLKYQTGVNADTEIIAKQIDAQVELNKVAAASVQADKGWWVTAWMKPAAFYVSLSHYAAVVFDSIPMFGHQIGSWGIPALPGMYADMEREIILICVGIIGVKQVARIFTSSKG